jgi:hypothetical protein
VINLESPDVEARAGDHAMTSGIFLVLTVTKKPEFPQPTIESNSHLFDDWVDPIETGIRERVRGMIEEMIRGQLDAALSRPAMAGERSPRTAMMPVWLAIGIGAVRGP